MNVPLTPNLQKFVEDQVRAGRFATPAEVVEAGLARLMLDAQGPQEAVVDDDRGPEVPLSADVARNLLSKRSREDWNRRDDLPAMADDKSE